MAMMIRCILYPDAHLFVTSGGKEQGASILSSKVTEICRLIPAFKREIDWTRGKTQEGKDYCKYIFKNGSTLDNLAARESTRGQRRHGNKKIMTLLWSRLYNYINSIFIYNRKYYARKEFI